MFHGIEDTTQRRITQADTKPLCGWPARTPHQLGGGLLISGPHAANEFGERNNFGHDETLANLGPHPPEL